MSSQRFNFVTIFFSCCVIIFHLILIYTILTHFYDHKNDTNEQLLYKKLQIKKLIEDGKLEVENVASVFDRKNGWQIFHRKNKPNLVKIPFKQINNDDNVISTTSNTVKNTAKEKIYRLSQDDNEDYSNDKYDDYGNDEDDKEDDIVKDKFTIKHQANDDNDEIKTNVIKITSTEKYDIDYDSDDEDYNDNDGDDDEYLSDEYLEIDNENEKWMEIGLTTPLTIAKNKKLTTVFNLTNEGDFEIINRTLKKATTSTSTTLTTLPTTTTTTTTQRVSTAKTTDRPDYNTPPKHYDENDGNQIPSIHITQDLLRKMHQPGQHLYNDQRHKHRHHHHQNNFEIKTLNTTLVTALLDIGRGHWHTYGRTMSRYHMYMEQVLKLKVPLVAFVDNHSYEFVEKTREKYGLSHITKTYLISLNQLPLSRHSGVMKAIIHYELNNNGWKNEWDIAMKTHPEAKSAEYNLVVNSKPYFVYNASIDNIFNTHYFAWVDAGYGQGKPEYFPYNFEWKPHFPAGRISIAKITPYFDDIRRYTLTDLYRKDIAVISGGFFGGDSDAIQMLYHKYYSKMIELLFHYRAVDDDQTTFVLVINQSPKLFNILHADWFDAFKLFRR